MQNITIKSVEEKHSKDGSKTFYIVTDSKGAQLSTFDAETMAFQPGTVIEAEVEVAGKYTNLKSFKVVSNPVPGSPPASQPSPTRYGQDSPEKRRSIERQTALALAVDWTKWAMDRTDGKVSLTGPQPLTCAEMFYQWIANGTLPEALKPPAEKDTSPEKQASPDKDATKETPALIDEAWLAESLATLQKHDPRRWGTALVIDRLNKVFGIKGTDAIEMARQLNKEQAGRFTEAIQGSLKAIAK